MNEQNIKHTATDATQKLNNIRVGILGGAGYTGGELIRLLLHHPAVSISYIHSSSNSGKPINSVHTDLVGETDLVFSDTVQIDINVLFLCVGHGDAKKFLVAHPIPAAVMIIDLSQDFRLRANAQFANRQFVYGLPELNKAEIKVAQNIANPGCFATAIQLGLLPLAKAGILGEVYTTGITGATGAGQGLNSSSHFSWRANNIQAYKSLQHQHIHEIHQSLTQLQGNDGMCVNFVPWRGDFTRGIYTSSVIDCGLPLAAVRELYQTYYSQHPFTNISDCMIDLKQVVNTNKCLIFIEKQGNKIVVHSAIDNLLKGACGQALQNMNLLFNLNETLGLQLKASAF